jgi:RND family efflux transporter MFP subunit
MGIKTCAAGSTWVRHAGWMVVLFAALPATAAIDVALVTARPASGGSSLVVEGHLEPLRQATVSAQLGGTVLALLVKAGDRVKSGQTIARIDARDAQAGVQRSDAGLAQAEAEARNARLAAQRTRELRAQGFVSTAALDTAETLLLASQAAVQQAQAARAQASLAHGHAAVTAPFDAVVLATHLEQGDLASPGRAIATVYAPGGLRATAQVPLSLADVARGATRVEVELPGGTRVPAARIAELGSADPVSQTIEWRLDLGAAALPGLVPGQVARVHFTGAATPPATSAPARMRLPAAAVLRRGELTAVYVAQGEGFVLRAVRAGADLGPNGVEILAGLKPGEAVAANAVQAGLVGARPAR